MIKVLFVCMGNICRSPAAQSIFQSFVKMENLQDKIFVDSAGTIGYHEGDNSDPRMIEHASKRKYVLDHLARKIREDDLMQFNYIITMDDENYSNVLSMVSDENEISKISKMTDYCKYYTAKEVPDPYYGGAEGFEYVIDLLEDACYGLLEKIKKDFPELNGKD